MAATTTTVTGPIETLGGSALSGKYIRFTLLTSGTETATGDLVAASTTSELLDANGDFSATLWVNGESGVESIYRIEIPGDTLSYDVIIPTSAGGGSISVEDLIENHQTTGTPQQSSTLAQAQAYTDALAADPSGNFSFSASEWKTDLGVVSVNGGGQLGTSASSTSGGAIGNGAFSNDGGAVGYFAAATTGGAVGNSAGANNGGAVGNSAAADDGFAGGNNAFANGTGRVQLGTGTNSTDSTIQFLSSGSVTAAEFGRIPQILSSVVRVSQASDLAGTLDSTKVYVIDGIIDMGSQTIEVPSGGLSIIGSTFDISQLTSSENTYAMFTSPVGNSGNLVLKNIGITTSGTGSSVFALTDATGFNAIEIEAVNFNNCTSLGYLDGYRQGLESGTGRFGGTPELEFRNTWVGGYRADTTIARGMSNFTSLFKAGTGFTFAGRVILGMNCDLPATGAFCDFAASNIDNDESLQLTNCRVTRSGALDASDTTVYPNIDHTNVKCLWDNNAGLPNTTKYIKANITTEVATTVSATSTYYALAGTFTVETSSHLDMPSNGELRLLSGNGTYQISGDFIIDGPTSDEVNLRVTKSTDGGSTWPTEITVIRREVNAFVGSRDVAFVPINFIATLQEDDRIRIEVSNESSTGNLTAELDSYFIVTAI